MKCPEKILAMIAIMNQIKNVSLNRKKNQNRRIQKFKKN